MQGSGIEGLQTSNVLEFTPLHRGYWLLAVGIRDLDGFAVRQSVIIGALILAPARTFPSGFFYVRFPVVFDVVR